MRYRWVPCFAQRITPVSIWQAIGSWVPSSTLISTMRPHHLRRLLRVRRQLAVSSKHAYWWRSLGVLAKCQVVPGQPRSGHCFQKPLLPSEAAFKKQTSTFHSHMQEQGHFEIDELSQKWGPTITLSVLSCASILLGTILCSQRIFTRFCLAGDWFMTRTNGM